ncbi:unnamed protein product [Linum trigynum]
MNVIVGISSSHLQTQQLPPLLRPLPPSPNVKENTKGHSSLAAEPRRKKNNGELPRSFIDSLVSHHHPAVEPKIALCLSISPKEGEGGGGGGEIQ